MFNIPDDLISMDQNALVPTPTGYSLLDEYLCGGLNSEGLTVVCASSAGGKTVFMMNIALNMAKQGLPILHIPLEQKYEVVWDRYKELAAGECDREVALSKIFIQQGRVLMNADTVDSMIKQYIHIHNAKPAIVVIDFLDLMNTIEGEQEYNPDKNIRIMIELDKILSGYGIMGLTAVSMNRKGYYEMEQDDFSGEAKCIHMRNTPKTCIAVNVDHNSNKFHVYLAFSRHGGSNEHVYLNFNPYTARILDSSHKSLPNI